MSNPKSKKLDLSDEEIQKLIDEIEAVEVMSDEEYEKWFEERLRKEAEWMLNNNKIQHTSTLNRDTFNLTSRAHWFTDLDLTISLIMLQGSSR